MTIFYIWSIVTLVVTLFVKKFYEFRFEVYKRAASRSLADDVKYDKFITKTDLNLDRAFKFPILTSFISIIFYLTVISPRFGIMTEMVNIIVSKKIEDTIPGIVIICMAVYSVAILLVSINILFSYLSKFYFKLIKNFKVKEMKENIKEDIINFFVKKTINDNDKISNNIKKPDNSRI